MFLSLLMARRGSTIYDFTSGFHIFFSRFMLMNVAMSPSDSLGPALPLVGHMPHVYTVPEKCCP